MSGQRPFIFINELYLIRFAKFSFDLFLPFFRKLIHFIVRLFSPPLWLKLLSLAGSRFISLPLAYPTHTFWFLLSLSRIISLWVFSPFWVDFSLSPVFLSFPPFWLRCYAYDCRYDNIIFSRFPLLTHKSFLHFNVSRYFGFSSLEFWFSVFL